MLSWCSWYTVNFNTIFLIQMHWFWPGFFFLQYIDRSFLLLWSKKKEKKYKGIGARNEFGVLWRVFFCFIECCLHPMLLFSYVLLIKWIIWKQLLTLFHICSWHEAPKEEIRAWGEKLEIVLGWLRYGMAIAWSVK